MSSNLISKVDARKKTITPTGTSEQLCQHIAESQTFRKAKRVCLFCSQNHEPDLKSLWLERPEASLFPRVNTKNNQIEFFFIQKWSDLEKGYAGIKEPKPDPKLRFTDWENTDLVLVPGRSFDPHGSRVGSGKGFYDRFLANTPSFRWGVGWSSQISSQPLAQELTDIKMQALCTEVGIIYFE